jgi:hypothetical protein
MQLHPAILAGVCLVANAASAQRSLFERLPPDLDAGALALPSFPGGWAPIVLPGEGPLQGIAVVDERLWVARGASLLAFDWPGTAVAATVAAPERVLALTADPTFLYALRTAEVLVLDGMRGEVVGTLPLPATAAPVSAFAVGHGELQVLCGAEVVCIELRTRVARSLPAPEAPLSSGVMLWHGIDGASLWAARDLGPGRRNQPGEPQWDPMARWPAAL